MRRKNNAPSRFAVGLLIYILVFLLSAAAVLVFFGLYLRAYEASRSNTCVRSYLHSGAGGTLDSAWLDALSALDTRLQPEAESRSFLQGKLAEAAWRELGSENSGEKRYELSDADGVRFA